MLLRVVEKHIFLFMNLLDMHDLYPSTSWIVMKGILKDVEIPEMTIPAIIVDFANLNQCLP